jgi:single-stranded-DNA-specific exonuclease
VAVAESEAGWPLTHRDWELRQTDPEKILAIESGFGLSPSTARVLASRGITETGDVHAYLNPSLDGLHSPFEFVQMEAAVARLLSALDRNERVFVHGDYDVDGITATVVLVTCLRSLGGDVGYSVSHRLREGYGLTPSNVERAHEAGAKVLVSVDCGITAHPAAERARQLGIDLIIADHHQPGEEIPDALAVLDPCLPDSGYPESDLAAVGVAFKLGRGVLQRHGSGRRGTALLKLVAIGTVADLAPLRGENRIITHNGLKSLKDAVNPGLLALMDVSGVGRASVTTTDVAFRLAPRINAAGRIDDASAAIEMFLTGDPGRARRLAKHLNKLNGQRQELGEEILQAALQQVPSPDDAFVVAAGDGWHRGVIGIVASRLVEQWRRPAVVISIEGDEAHGSARSIAGFDILAALRETREHLDEFGGHQQAAGLRLKPQNVGAFREALLATGRESLEEALERTECLECDAELPADVSLRDLALELGRLAPFGAGNQEPRFICSDMEISGNVVVINGSHLKMKLSTSSGDIEAIAWRQARVAPFLSDCRRIDAVANLQMRRWRGRNSPQLVLEDFRPAGSG